MFSKILVSFFSFIVAHIAFGQQLPTSVSCNSLTECSVIQERITSYQQQLNKIVNRLPPKQLPKFLDFPKDSNGFIKVMDYSEAYHYCSANGARLPTIVELFDLAEYFGARGKIYQTFINDVLGAVVPPGFAYFNSSELSGLYPYFYYNADGFDPIKSNFSNNLIWSDSHTKYLDQIYLLDGRNGWAVRVDIPLKNTFAAVRCVLN